MSVNVYINDVVKKYGDFTAIHELSLEIKEGEFFTLLGPSGCGKTTLLRMIAGFNSIEAGTISFDDVIINDVPAHKRDTGMVFQNYAVFPHLSIYDNVGYGLKARKVAKDERHRRIMEALEIVQIAELKDRMPSALSGGQQQRVALARAIVIEPKILLMDEPLSNLDAKLRVQMRTIIKKLQRQLNITTIYVTHDQEEALAISDRIAVMNKGVVMQLDAPDVIYKNPSNAFVANFIGTSNFVEGTYEKGILKIYGESYPMNLTKDVSQVKVSVRPSQFLVSPSATGIKGKILISTFLGEFVNYEVELEDGTVVEVNEFTQNQHEIRTEGDIYLTVEKDEINVYDIDGIERLNA